MKRLLISFLILANVSLAACGAQAAPAASPSFFILLDTSGNIIGGIPEVELTKIEMKSAQFYPIVVPLPTLNSAQALQSVFQIANGVLSKIVVGSLVIELVVFPLGGGIKEMVEPSALVYGNQIIYIDQISHQVVVQPLYPGQTELALAVVPGQTWGQAMNNYTGGAITQGENSFNCGNDFLSFGDRHSQVKIPGQCPEESLSDLRKSLKALAEEDNKTHILSNSSRAELDIWIAYLGGL